MRIQSSIDYWKDGVLSFDPEKIIIRLKSFFPQTETDWKDQSRYWHEKFFQTVKKKGLEPPSKIVESKWEVFSRNTPTFLFKILAEPKFEINGLVNRWRIEFKSEKQIASITEKIIIDFFKSIEYGDVRSDTQTKYFCKSDENYKDHWLLEESV